MPSDKRFSYSLITRVRRAKYRQQCTEPVSSRNDKIAA